MKYRNKKDHSEIVEAHLWFENGDHPGDDARRPFEDSGVVPTYPREGKVVRRFRQPGVPGNKKCPLGCGFSMDNHGWIDNTVIPGHVSEDGTYSMMVCPGDYVISHWNGKAGAIISYLSYSSMHPKEFEEKYEKYKEPVKSWMDMDPAEYGKVHGTGISIELNCPHCNKMLSAQISIQQAHE
jgi:hypothetical protein